MEILNSDWAVGRETPLWIMYRTVNVRLWPDLRDSYFFIDMYLLDWYCLVPLCILFKLIYNTIWIIWKKWLVFYRYWWFPLLVLCLIPDMKSRAVSRFWKVWASRSNSAKATGHQPQSPAVLPNDLTYDNHGGLFQLSQLSLSAAWW